MNAAVADVEADSGPPPWQHRVGTACIEHGPLGLVLAILFVIITANQNPGHDWGDDFSLYLRQTDALVNGGVSDVLADNRFTVDNSSWSSFSPYSYGWGTPILWAPLYRIVGADYSALKMLTALFFVGALAMFYRLMKPRLGWFVGGMVMLTIALSSEFVAWTDTVLSEFPYLACLFTTLWWLDRCRERGELIGDRLRSVVVLGVMIGFTYSVRREGMALLAALAAAQAAVLWRRAREDGWEALQSQRWTTLLAPYVAAGLWVAGLQVILPTVLYQSFEGTGAIAVKPNVIWYRDIFAQQLGLKDFGVPDLGLFGSRSMAMFVLAAVVALSIVGIFSRLITHADVDASLAAYLLGVSFIFAVTPFHEGRYLFSITPLVLYFAAQGIADPLTSALRALGNPHGVAAGAVAASMLVAPMLVSNADTLWARTERQIENDFVIWGPEHPQAQELFAAVRDITDDDDVVAFFRARLMTFSTDRRALQLVTLDHVLERSDWYAMAKNSTYSQILVTDEEARQVGLTKVWENDGFVIWQVPDAS